METSTLIVKIIGAVLLVWTIRSIYLHIKEKKTVNEHKNQSVTEHVLNSILLYLWLAFLLAFSTGMIVNN